MFRSGPVQACIVALARDETDNYGRTQPARVEDGYCPSS